VYCAVAITGTPVEVPDVPAVRLLSVLEGFDENLYSVGRTVVEDVAEGEVLEDGTVEAVSESWTLTLDVTDDNTEYPVMCVATSLNPDFVLARYRSEVLAITAITLETPDVTGDSSLVYVVCTTLFMLVAAFFY
jgi:hypothetical protein